MDRSDRDRDQVCGSMTTVTTMTPSDIPPVSRSVRTAFKGNIATSVKPLKAEEEINVIVRFKEKDRGQLEAFDKILVRNQFGKLVPLGSVAEVVEEDGVYTISHTDGKRVIHVAAEVDEDVITSVEINQLLQKEFGGVSSASDREPAEMIKSGWNALGSDPAGV